METNQKNERLELLKEQYTVAVDLYKHEDLLNWNKLNNFFYVTSALIFILGYFISANQSSLDEVSPSILIVLGVAGVLVSLSFTVTIWSGVKYLQDRKEKVVDIEGKLKKYGGVFIVGVEGGSQQLKRDLKISPTTRILKTIPLIFALGWVLLLVFCIINSIPT